MKQLHLIVLTVFLSIFVVGCGCDISFSGVVLPQLTASNEKFNTTTNKTESLNNDAWFKNFVLTQDEAALFSSSVSLGAGVGAGISGILLVIFGQKKIILCLIPIKIIAWVVAAASTIPLVLILCRFVIGVVFGILGLASAMMLIEISHNDYRGQFISFMDFSRNFGILIMYSIGYSQLWWRYQSLIIGLTTTMPAFIALFFMHDSPRWLLIKSRKVEAEKALLFYRGPNCNIENEVIAIKIAASLSENEKIGIKDQFKYMFQPRMMKLMFYTSFCMIGINFSGNFALIAYAANIISDAAPSIDPYLGAVLLGVFRSVGGIISIYCCGRFSRRKTIMVTTLICSGSMAVLGLYNFLQVNDNVPQFLWWVPVVFLMIFFCFVTISTPVTALLCHELVPLKFRLIAVGFQDIFFFLGSFIVAQTFTFLKENIYLYGTFWLYAISSLVIAFIPYILLPETAGRKLEDIEADVNRI